jgi:hypothetical protein
MGRPGSGGAFAKSYIAEVETNFAKLKQLISISNKK